jgi:lysozyme family protein
MASIENAIPFILEKEGGYVNNKNDKGGKTKYGISEHQYPNLDIENLTQQDAINIIEEDYWNPNFLDKILSQSIANQCLSLIINMNPVVAIKIIQVAINENNRRLIDLKIDGIMGIQTINTINSSNSYLIDNIKIQACIHYLELVDIDNTKITFLRGWIRRILL